ncbi:DnaK suppressor protein [Allocatelliglobosispora scoriae]|uniref:DnaK suppressor protein n=1 Tax=Allocatelliglobosispora scoriae TaxID=643052 RepID=A0A841BMG7_9ACTN|nr:TraR/DksA C4-type zinc finger protein [Allocatelliglobosispora scoriae]MBB5868456.1 DnaK suppressor protein [Allocatelliglobosispora scoriae]
MTITLDRPLSTDIGEMLHDRHREAVEQHAAQIREIEASRRSVQDVGDVVDLGSRAAETSETDMVAEALHQQVLRLEAAIARHEAGGFGVCASCDGEIPAGRLEIMPWATHCVPCGQSADRRR